VAQVPQDLVGVRAGRVAHDHPLDAARFVAMRVRDRAPGSHVPVRERLGQGGRHPRDAREERALLGLPLAVDRGGGGHALFGFLIAAGSHPYLPFSFVVATVGPEIYVLLGELSTIMQPATMRKRRNENSKLKRATKFKTV
jgi:hypothetical protein